MAEARAGLANLPFEIASQIINYVADPNGWWELRAPSEARYHDVELENLEPVQNLRLTCRALWRIATPILFSVLRVSLNYQSLEAFEQLCEYELVAAHARRVIVDLKTYRSDMAADLATFTDAHFQAIRGRFRSLAYELESLQDLYGDEIVDDDGEIKAGIAQEHNEDVISYKRNQGAWRVLIQDWSKAAAIQLMRGVGEEEADANLSEQGAVLLRAYAEYAKRHQEHVTCINDAEAMTRIATSISQLTCGGKILFLADADGRSLDPEASIADLVYDSEQLHHFLVQPHAWEDVQHENRIVNLEAAKVLTRLPVALADAGVPLTELNVGCFPYFTNEGFSNLLLRDGQQPAELEAELRSAFQHLQDFSFGEDGMNCRPVRRSHLPPADLALMHAYLSAAAASSQLNTLRLSFRTYELYDRGSRGEASFGIGPVLLSCAAASKLTWVSIRYVQVTQDELQPFLLRLAAGKGLEILTICDATLTGRNSSWAPALDAMRDAVAHRYSRNLCGLRLSSLQGAEFGYEKRIVDYGCLAESYDWTSDSDAGFMAGRPLLRQANAYAKGKTSTNPLLVRQEQE